MTAPFHARLVGRETELAAVRIGLASPGAVVLVEGEAGIGKSRLVREYLAALPRAERARVLVAVCPPLPTPGTLGAIIDAVRPAGGEHASRLSALGGVLHPLLPEWGNDLPPPLPPTDDAATSRRRVYRALAELFELMEVRTLVVEDLHWADDATVEFLVSLAARPAIDTAMALTVRPGDLPADSLVRRLARFAAGASGTRLALTPLDIPTTARLVESMLDGQPVSEEFAAFLHNATDGLPLAIEETVRLLTDRADVVQRDGAWLRRHVDKIPLPPTIRDIVLERRDRLPASARTVLDAAAVLDQPADTALLTTVAAQDPEASRDGIVAAVRSGLLATDDRGAVTYSHALTARAVYEAIPVPTRQQMHARAGAALAERGGAGRSPGPIARHFREAGDTARWITYAEQAADLARRTGAEATSIALLHDLFVNGDLAPADVDRLIGKFPIGALGSRQVWQHLVDVIERTLMTGDLDPGLDAQLRYRYGAFLQFMYETAAGRQQIRAAVPNLGHQPVRAAHGMLMLGWPNDRDQTAAEHHAWLERAAEITAELPEDQRPVLHADRIIGLLMLGDSAGWTGADELLSGGGPAMSDLALVRFLFNLGDQATIWGRYQVARDHLDRGAEIAAREEYLRLLGVIRVTGNRLDWLTGEWSELKRRCAELRADDDLAQGSQDEVAVVAGQHAIATGDDARGRPPLHEMVDGWERSGALHLLPEAAAALAWSYLHAGDPAAATSITDEPVVVLRGKGLWFLAADMAPARVAALLASGDSGAAHDLTAEFADGLRDLEAPAARAGLATCRALLADSGPTPPDAAAALWRAAAEAWAALPRPYDAHRATAARGAALARAGDAEAALAAYTEAIAGLRSLGATAELARVKVRADADGIAIPIEVWRGGRRGYGNELSPREEEVVRLVASGMTNREVAAAVHRSPHTVDTQLRSAMRKLGVTSRTALALWVLADRAGERP